MWVEGVEAPVDQYLDSVCDQILVMNPHKYLQTVHFSRRKTSKEGSVKQGDIIAAKSFSR
jgi:hypothetical protein